MRLHDAADLELYAAASHYEEREAGLGDAFLDVIGGVFSRIERLPLSFPVSPFDARARRAIVPRFPYLVFFALDPSDTPWIVAVAHEKREPGYWRERL